MEGVGRIGFSDFHAMGVAPAMINASADRVKVVQRMLKFQFKETNSLGRRHLLHVIPVFTEMTCGAAQSVIPAKAGPQEQGSAGFELLNCLAKTAPFS